MKKLIVILLCLSSITITIAQVKIGQNPTTIQNNTNLEVESSSGSRFVVSKDSSKVGIGTSTPGAKLDVLGKVKISDGTEGAGKVFISNASGIGSWQTPGTAFAGIEPWYSQSTNVGALSNTDNIYSMGNIGIKNQTPTSTLAVNGSLARKYKSIITATYQVLSDDYFLQYKGTATSVFTLPSGTSAACNCQGRVYEILNSTSYEVTVNPNGGETIDSENSIKILANQSVKILNTGSASGATWTIVQFSPTKASPANYEVYSTSFNGKVNTVETLATVMTALQSADLVVTIPSGYANNRVLLRWDLWGAGYPLVSSQAAGGSLVFDIENVGNTVYSPVLYTSFASVATLLNARFTAPVAYYLTDMAPGTYTFKLRCALIDTANVHSADIRGISAIATVYVK